MGDVPGFCQRIGARGIELLKTVGKSSDLLSLVGISPAMEAAWCRKKEVG